MHRNEDADNLLESGSESQVCNLDATSTIESNIQEVEDDTSNSVIGNRPELFKKHQDLKKNWLILEPAVFLLFLGRYLIGAVYTNQVLYQACITICHYNSTQCQPLLGINRESDEAKIIETKVQPFVTRILMTASLLESIIPAFISLLIGPWSDKFGRRPVLLVTFTGYFISGLILTVLTYISTKNPINPWWFLLYSVPSVLSGGTCSLITGIYCYISDVAKEHTRAYRMVLNEASLCAGMMIGSVVSGYIYIATDAVTIFAIATALLCLSVIYVLVFVTESLKQDQIHTSSRFREFFRFDLVKDLVCTCTQRRPNYNRMIIWLTMISLTIAIFTMSGEDNVNYLFLRQQFDWTITDYSLYNAARIVIQIVGSIFGMFLLRRILRFSIIAMSMISLACCVLESVVRATAIYWWEMYVGMVLGIMRGIMGPMCRAILSYVTPTNEIGKIFALTTSLESVSPVIASPLYTYVYNSTLEFYPGVFNFISAGLYLLCYSLIAVIFGIQKSHPSVYPTIGS